MSLRLVLFAIALSFASSAHAAEGPTQRGQLEGFEYPYPVTRYAFTSQRQPLSMAYMDIAPTATPNGRTVVLLHGKNFCAATWEGNIPALTGAGYRVIAIDQVGFCKSSKPAHYQFSLAQLAGNTHALLASLGIQRATVVGHSMGGMLAIRYALQYPDDVEQLVLVDPIGLEDWKAKGVPWRSIDAWFAGERATTFDSIKRYQQATYYGGAWKPAYDRWVAMLAGMYAGPDSERVAWNQALTSDMVFNQPVVYELPQLAMPVTLFIGHKDNTAIGKDRAPPDVRATLGNYPELGRRAAKAIPHATLVEFKELGHSPQVQDPARFNAAMLKALAGLSSRLSRGLKNAADACVADITCAALAARHRATRPQ